ncbi:CHASE2 domain-containing protein [Ovoidimarina sediminis]|uniref:CHASE2 domain-containing protein n=1 Tax=Ovoidimarina sediminis TaxID=3079856 RepID=UPI002914DA0F|nr:adenylate/guanylate cyclase domain-containing protein [Rhodophyticola sp. MJ-SS7]MDU8943261.1 adenylate/guanylate cyclase domain-containing protein [Rhodophyticola sp. MJ-SS7]
MTSRLTWIIGVSVTALMLMLYALAPRSLEQISGAVLDTYQRAAPRIPNPDTPVHVIDIDEASLDELGQWPWPRTYLAELTHRLFDMGAAAIGYDILFAEPDRTSPEAVLTNLSRFEVLPELLRDSLIEFPDHDVVFAEALNRGPTVLALAGAPRGAAPPPKAGIAYTGRLPADALTAYAGVLAPLDGLGEAAAGLGAISLESGADGITRSVPMVALYDGTVLPAFTAELLRVAQGAGGHVLATSERSGEISGGTARPVAMRTGALAYPLDGNGHFRIHFSEPDDARITSAHRLLTQPFDPEQFRPLVEGKIVLIGSSAQALFDIRSTPLAAEVPGVLLHAEILEQIIDGDFLARPDWSRGLEIVLILFVGLSVTALAARDRPVLGLGAAFTSVTLLLVGGWLAFLRLGLLIDPVLPALTALAVYLPATTVSVFGKERARATIRDRFGYFLPKQVIDEIASDPDSALSPTGVERDITVMFVDMRRFTSLTERMKPEDVVRLLNIYLSAVSEALVDQGATIDKFIGDATMAFWNAPIAVENHAARAIDGIFAVEAAARRANDTLVAAGLPAVETRIGVNTGPAFVGLMGSRERYNYSCVGDTVTLAARLEGLTRLYGTRNLVGEVTVASLPPGYRAIAVDKVVVKGRTGAVTAFTLLRDSQDARRLSRAIDAVRRPYVVGDLEAASQALEALEVFETDLVDVKTLAELYRERIRTLQSLGVPEDWNGIYEALEKR